MYTGEALFLIGCIVSLLVVLLAFYVYFRRRPKGEKRSDEATLFSSICWVFGGVALLIFTIGFVKTSYPRYNLRQIWFHKLAYELEIEKIQKQINSDKQELAAKEEALILIYKVLTNYAKNDARFAGLGFSQQQINADIAERLGQCEKLKKEISRKNDQLQKVKTFYQEVVAAYNIEKKYLDGMAKLDPIARIDQGFYWETTQWVDLWKQSHRQDEPEQIIPPPEIDWSDLEIVDWAKFPEWPKADADNPQVKLRQYLKRE